MSTRSFDVCQDWWWSNQFGIGRPFGFFDVWYILNTNHQKQMKMTALSFAFFSRMRSEGFSFYTLGVWGLRCVRWTPLFVSAMFRYRTQPYATVRKWPFEGKLAVPLGSFTGVRHFWTFYVSPTFVSRGRRGTSWHVDVFGNVWKIVFRSRRNTFATFFKTCVTFFVPGAALWTCPTQFFVASAALQTCRVACFSQIPLARLRAMATTCKFRGRRGISWHVSRLEEVSHEMLVLRFARASLRVSGCAVTMGEAAKALRLRMCQSVKIGGSLARNARFDACMCVVLRFWLCSGCAVTMGEVAKPYLWECVKVSKLVEVSHEMLVLMLACV